MRPPSIPCLSNRRRPRVAACALAAGLALALSLEAASPRAAAAASTCYSQTCGACTPPAGQQMVIDTLIPAAAFPANSGPPISFVDPDDGRPHRFVATQKGLILVWDGLQFLATPFLDLTAKVSFSGERGLLALAVAPDYETSGELYVYYTRSGTAAETGDIVIERYLRSAGDPEVGDPTAMTLLVIDHPAGNHNGGWLAFGPDGMLYVSTGDGGGGCDSTGPNGQNLHAVLGKILRLDVRGVDPAATPPECGLVSGPYEIPTGNPFRGADPAGNCGEIWAYGLRNPFRFGFDRATGDLYVGDVGQGSWEEIDAIPALASPPLNFAWHCREGCQSLTCGAALDCPAAEVSGVSTCQASWDLDPGAGVTTVWDPILCHQNGGLWTSIMGGYRYRGQYVPSLAGRYVYGDASCGQLWATDAVDPASPIATAATCWDSGNGGLYGFAEDHVGELYLVNGGAGRIDCVHAGSGCTWSTRAFDDDFEGSDLGAWSATQP